MRSTHVGRRSVTSSAGMSSRGSSSATLRRSRLRCSHLTSICDLWIHTNVDRGLINLGVGHCGGVACEDQAVLLQPFAQIGGRVEGRYPPLKADVALAVIRDDLF